MLRIAMALAVAGLFAPATTQEIVPNVGARTVPEPDGSKRFGWPGSYFEGWFRGTDVTVALDSAQDHFRILIDGKPVATLEKPGRVERRFAGLAEGEHVVRLEMLTENQGGESRFLGFRTSGAPLPAWSRKRRIQFIGDSHSVGYGNTSAKRDCTPAEVHDTTDTQQAFGPLLAKRLDADFRVIAYSGFGIVRNYAGARPGENLPALYHRAIPGVATIEMVEPFEPQLVVINLGTNDFSTELKPGEAWKDRPALRAAWRKAYGAFLADLRKQWPRARFVLMGAANFIADVRAVAGTGASAIEVPQLQLTGCDWHPSLEDHRVMADLVGAEVEKLRLYMD